MCTQCHLGLILTAGTATAPAAHEAFLVVDDIMRIRAVSKRAERLLGVEEREAVNRHLGDLLVPVEPQESRLAATVAGVSRSDGLPHRAVLRPRATFGVRYGVRIGACSPGPAAVLVLAEHL